MIKILWVDDEKDFLEMMAALLNSNGFETQTSLSGLEALEIYEKGSFDIVVTDYAMPNMNGLELIRKLRKINNNLPIILATGKPVSPSQLDEFDTRITRCIFKPFNSEQITSLITDILDFENEKNGGEAGVDPAG